MRIKFWAKRLCGDDAKTKKTINAMISTEGDYMGSKKAFSNANAKFKKNGNFGLFERQYNRSRHGV